MFVSRSSSEPATTQHSRLVPIIIGSALFMQTFDATVIANALPAMAVALDADPLRLNLAISGYLLSTAVFLPVSSWAADRFGARSVFAAAIVLFALSSALCGMSRTLAELIVARVLQGAAGAMLAPVGRLVLLKTVPKAQLIRAMATLTMPALLGPVIGPVLGGAIVTYSSWRWIFYINIPIGVIGVGLVLAFVPNIREQVAARLDVRGFLLTGAGLGGLMFALENVGRDMLSAGWLAGLTAASVICLLAYVGHSRRTVDPAVDLSLFRIPTFTASLVGGLFARLVVGASPFLLALLLQIGFGLSALEAGAMTFTSAAGALFMKVSAPPIIRAFGFRRVLVANTVITSAILMTYPLFNAVTPHALLILVLFSGGFFRSLQFTSLQALAFADVPQAKMSRASSLTSMGQQLSQAIGVAVAAVTLHVTLRLNGSAGLSAGSVGPAFVVIGVLSLFSLWFFLRLPRDAAAEVSGASTSRGKEAPHPVPDPGDRGQG
jgi:EmrB/QacA subfamily drug resistance transporter